MNSLKVNRLVCWVVWVSFLILNLVGPERYEKGSGERVWVLAPASQIGSGAESDRLTAEIAKWIKELGNRRNPDGQLRAVEALGKIGPAAAPAVPALIVALGDLYFVVRWEAVGVLGKIGPAAVPGLIKALGNSDGLVQILAAEALGEMGPAAESAVPGLIRALGDSDNTVREKAAEALGKIGPAAAPAVPALIVALGDSHGSVAGALGRIGPEAGVSISTNLELERLQVGLTRSALAEFTALGVLPTIGLKPYWPGAAIGNSSSASLSEGINHSWESHGVGSDPDSLNRIQQVSLYSDWFPNIHLIAATQLILFPPADWDPRKPPAHIPVYPLYSDEVPVGFLVGSGGDVKELPGMRDLPQESFQTNRIDYLWGKDLRAIQLLMLAGISAQMAPGKRNRVESKGAEVWERVTRQMSEILNGYKLQEFVKEEWFYPEGKGWQSNIHGIRYERRYPEIQGGIEKLFALVRSSQGGDLRQEVAGVINPLLDELEAVVWIEGLKRLPDFLLRGILIHESLDEEVKGYAFTSYLTKKRSIEEELTAGERLLKEVGGQLIPMMVGMYTKAEQLPSHADEIRDLAWGVIREVILSRDSKRTRDGIEQLLKIAKNPTVAVEGRAFAIWSLQAVVETDLRRRSGQIGEGEMERILHGLRELVADPAEIHYDGDGETMTLGQYAQEVVITLSSSEPSIAPVISAVGTGEEVEEVGLPEVNGEEGGEGLEAFLQRLGRLLENDELPSGNDVGLEKSTTGTEALERML